MTNWTENLGRVGFIVILGVIFGLALGRSIFRRRTAFVMGLVYSLFVIPWQLGLLMAGEQWGVRLELLYAHLWYAVADFLANRPVTDPILFLTTMYALYWFTSLISAFELVRRANPWIPLLALGAMVLVIEYTMEMYRYAEIRGGIYSFLFLVFCLLLMGRLYYLRSRKDWEERGGTVEMEVGYDLGRGVAIAAVVVVLLAWNTPRVINFFESNDPSHERVTAGWRTFRERISRAVDSLRSPSPLIVEGYGSNMFLGTGGELTDEVMLTVKPATGRQSARFYWSGRTYDTYFSGQWLSTISGTRGVGPGREELTYPEWDLRRELQLTFNTRISLLKTLYFVSDPLNISRSADAVVAVAPDGSVDLNAIVLDPPLKAGEEYTVLARISQPTVMAMREAGEEYPGWVTERYLQLPDRFSPRIAGLAQQVAGDEATPYDKAVAVTQYLRRTITYSESIPEPPRNQDPIEWFLFDLQSGFCNYYASAEILMLRSLGVPTRMVVGFAEGTWDPEVEAYVVLGKDSHAWPEVFFPGLGWVPFEPTVSQPLTTFPTGEQADAANAPNPGMGNIEPTFDPFTMMNQQQNGELFIPPVDDPLTATIGGRTFSIWTILLFGALVVLAVFAFFAWRRRSSISLPLPSWLERTLDERGFRTPDWLRTWSRRALRTPIEALFSSISFMLRVWGQKVDPALTPAEQVALLINVVPGVRDQALVLLDEYQRAMYSQYPANIARAEDAVQEIRSVGYRTWVMRLVGLEA